MPLEMILAVTHGRCDKCGDDEWLYIKEGKLVCGYCLQDYEWRNIEIGGKG